MPEVGTLLLIALSLEAPVSLRTAEDSALGARLLRQDIGGVEHVSVAVGSRVVLSERARDEARVFRLTGPRDHDYLAVEVESNGPGTCVWDRRLDLYVVDAVGGDVQLVAVDSIPLGGILACAEGEGSRSCGCGTWAASWIAERQPRGGMRITTKPAAREHSGPAGAPPPAEVRTY